MILRTAIHHVLLLLATTVAARFENDFSAYPEDAISCLDAADARSTCDGDTVPEMNACLCGGDGNAFLRDAAQCIGEKSPDDLATTYAVFEINCDNTDTPMNINLAAFLDLAKTDDGEYEETGTGTATNTAPTDTPTDDPDPDDEGGSGLSTGVIIGIGVGAGVLVLGAIGLAVFCFLRKRKRRNAEESHPMLTSHSYGGAFPPVPANQHQQHGDGVYHSPNDIKAEPYSHKPTSPAWPPQPSPSSGLAPQQQGWGGDSRGTSWNSQQAGAWSASAHQSWVSGVQPYHQLSPGGATGGGGVGGNGNGGEPHVFELANTNTAPPPVEMPGSQPGEGPGGRR